MSPPTIVFRTDASLHIGTGHVMRCLTLATALQDRGFSCVFACRPFKGHLMGLIEQKGFAIVCLSSAGCTDFHANSYETWLGIDYESDAIETLSILANSQLAWLIVDHYGIDEKWERVVSKQCQQLIVIDDLLNRHHYCDILVDSSYGRKCDEYSALVPADCRVYTGTSFCMLRPEFSHFRQKINPRDYQRQPRNILVTLGGVDIDNVTSQILQDLEAIRFIETLSVVVITGRTSPHFETIDQQARQSRHKVSVKHDVTNMAEHLIWADLCIGAVGSSVWERCCLGCPSIVTVLAANQREGAERLEKAGVLLSFSTAIRGDLSDQIQRMDSSMRESLSMNGMRLVDGLGVERVLDSIMDK